MKHEIFKTDTPELVAVTIDCEYRVTFSTQGGMEFEDEPTELVNAINTTMNSEFVGSRPVRKPK